MYFHPVSPFDSVPATSGLAEASVADGWRVPPLRPLPLRPAPWDPLRGGTRPAGGGNEGGEELLCPRGHPQLPGDASAQCGHFSSAGIDYGAQGG